jgi:hypothetical protein
MEHQADVAGSLQEGSILRSEPERTDLKDGVGEGIRRL